MDHDKYKYILAVAEYQSFSKAADALFISQPYLSKVVSTIERDLGVRLFDRNHMPLSVTAAGKCYIDYIKTVLHAEHQMYAGLTDISEHSSGTISLGIGSTHCSYLMPDVFRRFQDLYPHIRINFTEWRTASLTLHSIPRRTFPGIWTTPPSKKNAFSWSFRPATQSARYSAKIPPRQFRRLGGTICINYQMNSLLF